jgi:hypothetical protein
VGQSTTRFDTQRAYDLIVANFSFSDGVAFTRPQPDSIVLGELRSAETVFREAEQQTQVVDANPITALVARYTLEAPAGVRLIDEYFSLLPYFCDTPRARGVNEEGEIRRDGIITLRIGDGQHSLSIGNLPVPAAGPIGEVATPGPPRSGPPQESENAMPGSVPQVVILGVGDLKRCDEGVGVYVLIALEQRYEFPRNVRFLDGSVSMQKLLTDIADVDELIVLEAVSSGAPGRSCSWKGRPRRQPSAAEPCHIIAARRICSRRSRSSAGSPGGWCCWESNPPCSRWSCVSRQRWRRGSEISARRWSSNCPRLA